MAPIDALEEYLRGATIHTEQTFDMKGAHASYLIVLEGGVTVLAKPADEIGDGNVLVRREVAGWRLAQLLGWPDLVATTVLRQIRSYKTGLSVDASIQVLWSKPTRIPALASLSADDVWRAAIFDSVACTSDRGSNNWISIEGSDSSAPKLKLVDHGYAFGHAPAPPASDFYRAMVGIALPAPCATALKGLINQLPDRSLSDLLGAEADGVHQRAKTLLAKGTLELP